MNNRNLLQIILQIIQIWQTESISFIFDFISQHIYSFIGTRNGITLMEKCFTSPSPSVLHLQLVIKCLLPYVFELAKDPNGVRFFFLM
jgi:hypothetical protein